MSRVLSLLLLVVLGMPLSAQPDSTRLLTLGDFYAYLGAYHPILKQADQFDELFDGQRLEAFGEIFDPVVMGDWRQKELKGTEYWDDLSVKGKVPTPFGIDLIGGYDIADGTYLSSERSNLEQGLAYFGIGIPIGPELIVNRRWNILQQARLLPQMAEAERRKLATKLFLSATKDYLEWQKAYQLYQIAQFGVQIADSSLDIVRRMYQTGAMAQIDTVEAFLALQQRRTALQVTQYELEAARQLMSVHLWTPLGEPMELNPNLIPPPIPATLPVVTTEVRDSLLVVADTSHPELQKLFIKQQQLSFERRYRTVNLWPSANFEYKPLLEPRTPDWDAAFNGENYKFGLSFYVPLTSMKKRGKLAQVRAKLEQTQFELQQLDLFVDRSILAAWTSARGVRDAWAVQQRTVSAAQTMFEGELAKFRAGTSELFKVLYRQMVVLKEQENLSKLTAEFYKSRAELYCNAGAFPPLD